MISGLGALTEDLRAHLKTNPKPVPKLVAEDSDSSSSRLVGLRPEIVMLKNSLVNPSNGFSSFEEGRVGLCPC